MPVTLSGVDAKRNKARLRTYFAAPPVMLVRRMVKARVSEMS
jgi:hypothetical protein